MKKVYFQFDRVLDEKTKSIVLVKGKEESLGFFVRRAHRVIVERGYTLLYQQRLFAHHPKKIGNWMCYPTALCFDDYRHDAKHLAFYLHDSSLVTMYYVMESIIPRSASRIPFMLNARTLLYTVAAFPHQELHRSRLPFDKTLASMKEHMETERVRCYVR